MTTYYITDNDADYTDSYDTAARACESARKLSNFTGHNVSVWTTEDECTRAIATYQDGLMLPEKPESLMEFACRVYADDDQCEIEVPEHLKAEWDAYCAHIEIYHTARMYARER